MSDDGTQVWAPMEVVEGLLARAEKAEAAIQRALELCDHSRAVVHVGCRCSTDECSGTCGAGKPLAWDLDPVMVIVALDGASDE